MIECSPVEILGPYPLPQAVKPLSAETGDQPGGCFREHPEVSPIQRLGGKLISVTLTKFTRKDTLSQPRDTLWDCPLPLGFDSSKKAKPPAEPNEVLRPWGSACSQNPTRACGREDSLCCTARIYRGPSVGSTNCGSKMKYF